jgi:hypothetical protein
MYLKSRISKVRSLRSSVRSTSTPCAGWNTGALERGLLSRLLKRVRGVTSDRWKDSKIKRLENEEVSNGDSQSD